MYSEPMIGRKSMVPRWCLLLLLSSSFIFAGQAQNDDTNSISIDIRTPRYDNKEHKQSLARIHVLESDSRAFFVYSVDYHPSGQQLAGASLGRVYLWNPSSAASSTWELDGWVSLPQIRAVREVRYAPTLQDSRAATACDDGTVRIWSTATMPWSEVAVLTLPQLPSPPDTNSTANNANATIIIPQPRSLAWHPTGKYLAVAGSGLATAIYDTTTWRPLPLPFETVAHMAVMLHNNGNNGGDGAMDDLHLLAHYVDWSPSGQQLMVDSKVYDFDEATLELTPSTATSNLSFAKSHDNGGVPTITSTSFTRPQWKPDGKMVAAASGGVVGVASVDNNNTAATAVHLQTPSYFAVTSLQWSPDHHKDDGPSYLLVGGAGQPHVSLWRVPPDHDGNNRDEWTDAVNVPTSQEVGAHAVRWHPNGKPQFAVANAGVIDIWQFFSGDNNNADSSGTPAPTPLEVENIIEATNGKASSIAGGSVGTDGANVDRDTMHWAILLGATLVALGSVLALVGVLRLRWKRVAVVRHNDGVPNADSSSSSSSSDGAADCPSSHIGEIISIVACKSSGIGEKASFDTSNTEPTDRSPDLEHGLKKINSEEKGEDARLDDDNDSEEGVDDYDDLDWEELPPKVRRAAEVLGYNERMWNKNKSPPSEKKSWRRLSKREQKAARILGYNKEKWDAE